MRFIKDFENKKISVNDASILRGGDRIKGDTPGEEKDITVTDKNGQLKKFITGAGLNDGVPRDVNN